MLPSVLWRCWLGGRKGIRPVKNMEWWGAGVVICLERGANDLDMVQLMPLPPRHLLLQQNPEWLSFWYWPTQVVLEKKAVKWLCVCHLLKHSEWHVFNGTSVLPATHTFIHMWNEPSCLLLYCRTVEYNVIWFKICLNNYGLEICLLRSVYS